MIRWVILLLLPLALTAADDEKPGNRAKARELLDQAIDMAPAASPVVSATALLRLAQDYGNFDAKKSMELFDKAFQAAGAIPPAEGDASARLREEVVTRTARIDVEKALKFLQDFPSPPPEAVESVIDTLLAKKQLERAYVVLERYSTPGSYPFQAANTLLDKLAADDDRRVLIFSGAAMAYRGQPDPAYVKLVAKHWKTVPRAMAEQATKSLVEAILTRDDSGKDRVQQTLSTGKGSVGFDNAKDAELFDIMHVLKVVDPKRAQEVLDKHPSLAEALAKFPEGSASMSEGPDGDVNMNENRTSGGGGAPDPQAAARMRAAALSGQLAADARQLAAKDPAKGAQKALEIPVDSVRLQTLAQIASAASTKDPDAAKSVLNIAFPKMREVKNPQARGFAWGLLAQAAFQAGDVERAHEAIESGFEDAAALYKADTNADDPNIALRTQWPSTQQFRFLAYRAARLFGPDAANLLTKILDPDLQLLARIEVAGGLLGRDFGPLQIQIARDKKN